MRVLEIPKFPYRNHARSFFFKNYTSFCRYLEYTSGDTGMDKAKPLQFSPHAKQQMEQRKIAIEMVEETMSKGTHRTGNVAGRMIAEKPYGRMTLRVVYKKFRTSILIITAIKV